MSIKAASVILALTVALVPFSAADIPVMEDPMVLMNSTLDASAAADDAQLKLAFAENGFNDKARWWIAGTELGKTGSYVWITDNKPIEYTNFLPNEPNNAGGVEHCLEVGSGGIGSTQWNDYNCDNKLRYIFNAQLSYTPRYFHLAPSVVWMIFPSIRVWITTNKWMQLNSTQLNTHHSMERKHLF
ncbi:salivary C-type lectin [Culex quinquefasciatus]|uniref:Salivary C-type lectin n=1 Tax=Culex quinquefasciatus TaxID=7176 RepID=B0X2H9_CULQU|nr:salivary C-type lectin [Culex quinquefasciatus]|eukprot:XP_001863851.1 salivary C-type lectin [Culex quinquefasciatus]